MKQIIWFFKTYITLVLLFAIQKPLFMMLTHSSATAPVENMASSMWSVIWHGLVLDFSMAGYLMVIPALLLIAAVWIRKEIIRPVFNGYCWIAAFIMSLCFVLNIGLYPYWAPG